MKKNNFTQAWDSHSQDNNESIQLKGFAILELFTSEGCSSCPPADDLMGRLQKEHENDEVYILAFHVDYWDHQGWKDTFGNPDYTKRQYGYANLFKNHSVYTPQVVINGKAEYIGSQENSVRNAIKQAISEPAIAQLDLGVRIVDKELEVNYSVTGATDNNCLLLAIIQKSAQSNIKQGENANRTLSHFQIVRHLHGILLSSDENGIATLKQPKGFAKKGYEIIGFIQDMKTGHILGTTKFVF